ncbi:PREDICTED: uncharacterized protein LOC108368293 [Rhagoletis zephyria]|uniref:uncharacterized protein LOC108368293 n=1 Tax=Rhagoletis zephyria TaxID=28612 RepID=UPI00081185C8|nr:PREDICTED: uncharacterized protein LOC108368293 [Rhagoletis zephyria]
MLYQRNIEREKIAYKSIVEMAPCQVHPVIIHTRAVPSALELLRCVPLAVCAEISSVSRINAKWCALSTMKMHVNANVWIITKLLNHSAKQRNQHNKETEPSNESFPGLIAKELEAHEKETQKQNLKQKSSGEASSSSSSSSSLSQRQEQIEMTPTLSTKAKLRTLHTNSRANSDAATEDTRYRPYIKQTLITDVMPKRKSIPPP